MKNLNAEHPTYFLNSCLDQYENFSVADLEDTSELEKHTGEDYKSARVELDNLREALLDIKKQIILDLRAEYISETVKDYLRCKLADADLLERVSPKEVKLFLNGSTIKLLYNISYDSYRSVYKDLDGNEYTISTSGYGGVHVTCTNLQSWNYLGYVCNNSPTDEELIANELLDNLSPKHALELALRRGEAQWVSW